MAHERLRFPVLLKNSKNLQKVLESVYQPIFSDKAYDTHFGLFANFHGHPSDTNYCLDNLEVKIQNYSGDVSIGITKVLGHREKKLVEPFKIDGFSTGRLIKVYVLLQAFNSNKIVNYPEKGKEGSDSSSSLGLILKQGDVIEVTVLYEPVPNEFSKIKEDPDTRNETCLFADPKYLYRDGEEIGFLKGALDKMELIEIAKKQGLNAVLKSADSRSLESMITESFTEGDKEDLVFSAIGGGRPCKMKLSDVYILA